MRWERDVKHYLKVMKIYLWKKQLKVGMNENGSLSRPKHKKSCSTEEGKICDYQVMTIAFANYNRSGITNEYYTEIYLYLYNFIISLTYRSFSCPFIPRHFIKKTNVSLCIISFNI
jgi:hypothetical protein